MCMWPLVTSVYISQLRSNNVFYSLYALVENRCEIWEFSLIANLALKSEKYSHNFLKNIALWTVSLIHAPVCQCQLIFKRIRCLKMM